MNIAFHRCAGASRHREWQWVVGLVLFFAGCVLRSSAQTTAATAEVPQMLIFRNSGTVQVIDKDGRMRDVYATGSGGKGDDSYPATPAVSKAAAANRKFPTN